MIIVNICVPVTERVLRETLLKDEEAIHEKREKFYKFQIIT